jgi:hypothetical protein
MISVLIHKLMFLHERYQPSAFSYQRNPEKQEVG